MKSSFWGWSNLMQASCSAVAHSSHAIMPGDVPGAVNQRSFQSVKRQVSLHQADPMEARLCEGCADSAP